MNRYPLLNFYPVSDTHPDFFGNPRNRVLFADTVVRYANSPLEHVLYAAKGECVNGFDEEIKRRIRSTNFESEIVFRDAGLPGTTLEKYRHEYPSFRQPDPDDIMVLNDTATEVATHGRALAVGQVLFHGGTWPISQKTGTFLPTIYTDRVLSTTLLPSVAAIHANYHNPGQIWLLSVGPDSECKAIFYPPEGQLAHEYEVLISAGAKLQLDEKLDVGGMVVITATLT